MDILGGIILPTTPFLLVTQSFHLGLIPYSFVIYVNESNFGDKFLLSENGIISFSFLKENFDSTFLSAFCVLTPTVSIERSSSNHSLFAGNLSLSIVFSGFTLLYFGVDFLKVFILLLIY